MSKKKSTIFTAQNLFAFFDGIDAHKLDSAGFEMRNASEISGVLGAHFEHGGAFAFGTLIFAEMTQNEFHTLFIFGFPARSPRPQILDLLKYPWIPDGGASDHDGVHAKPFLIGNRFLRTVDVAVPDDRDGHARVVLHLADERPVGLAAVLLRTRASMDGDCLYADILQPFRHLHDGFVRTLPPQTRLHGHRQIHGLDDCGSQRDHLGNVLQNGRPRSFADNLLDRAAPVDVDKIGMGLRRQLRRRNERLLGAAKDLHAIRTLLLGEIHLTDAFFHRPGKRVRGNKLRNQHIRTELLAYTTERPVRHTLHRSQVDRELKRLQKFFYCQHFRAAKIIFFIFADWKNIISNKILFIMKKIATLLALVCALCSLSAQRVNETVTLFGKDQLKGFTINIDNTPINIVNDAIAYKFSNAYGLKGSKKKGFQVYENQNCSAFGDARYDIYYTTNEIGKKKDKSTQVTLVVSTGNMNCVTFSNDPRTSRNIVLFMEGLDQDVEAYKTKLRIEELKDDLANLEKERQSLEKDKQKVLDKLESTNSEIKKISDDIEKKTSESEMLQDKYNQNHDPAVSEQIATIVKEKQSLQKTYSSMQKSLLSLNNDLSKITTKLQANAKSIEEKKAELEKLQK